MPFMYGSGASHDDTGHFGSAKRDTASGVAGLDASGKVLALGNEIILTRDGTNNIGVRERTSNEYCYVITRMGLTDYQGYIREGGNNKRIQTASMKDVASGIAGLGAQKDLSGGIYGGLNLLKIATSDIFTESIVSAGTITYDRAAGIVTFDCPGTNDEAGIAEIDKIAPSLLPRIVMFRVNAITVNDAPLLEFGLASNVLSAATHYAKVAFINGTGWKFQTSAGGAVTTVAITALAAGDIAIIYLTSARALLYVNGTLYASSVTNIPTAALGRVAGLITAGGVPSINFVLGYMSA